MSSAIAGCEGALPSTYGKKAEELAESLNRCLAQFHEWLCEQSVARRAADRAFPEVNVTRGGRVNAVVRWC